MRILYVVTTGAADATLASLPVHLAVNGSVEAGQQPALFLAGHATELLNAEAVEGIAGIGVPPMTELFAKVREHEVPVYVWRGCAVARGATDDDLPAVNGQWITPPEVARLFAEVDKVISL